jgi:hypothetical protein
MEATLVVSGNTTANDGSGGRTASPKEMKDGGKKPPFQHGNQNQKTIVPRRHTKFEGKCNEIKGHIYDWSEQQYLTVRSDCEDHQGSH